jgi:hypothetical protein
LIASHGPRFRTGRRQDRTGEDTTVQDMIGAGYYYTWSLEIQPVDRFTWTMARRADTVPHNQMLNNEKV